MEVKTPEEVCKAVALDLRARNITHEEAGRRIGKTRNAVSNLLSRKARFSSKAAELFAREFGYDADYLMYGKGTLLLNQDSIVVVKDPDKWSPDPLILVNMLDIATAILRMTGNQNAKKAWTYFRLGKYDEFQKQLKLLQEETGEPFRIDDSVAYLVCSRAMDTFHSAPVLSSRKEMGLDSE